MWLGIAVLIGLVAAVMLTKGGPSSFFPLKDDSTWAFLVCGSRNFTNYRHQADVAHAYQVMLNQGIPPDRIITMMFDDVAYDKENPNPGVLINRPNGPNVYKGVKVDYRGWDVTPANFLNVLGGKKTAMKGIGTGRVIESDGNSTVFVYFTDHGGPGVLFLPDYVALSADHLHNTLREMYRKKQYHKLIMFIDACYVGSMFEGILEEDTGVLVFAGSARDEGSWPWYCESNNYTTCKGDEFSIKLWEYMDSVEPGAYKTLNELYQRVRTGVAKSHVQLYGDLSVAGYSFKPNVLGKMPVKKGSRSSTVAGGQKTSVKASDATLFYLKQKAALSRNLHTRLEAQRLLEGLSEGRKRFDEMMRNLVAVATADAPQSREVVNDDHLALDLGMFPCYKKLLKKFWKYCSTNDREYVIHHLYKLANICVLRIDTTKLLREMPRICAPYQNHINSKML